MSTVKKNPSVLVQIMKCFVSQCQCCSLLKNELQVFVNELKSMVEITNILKEELKHDNATRQDRLPK
jgi:hypothetical protein